MSERSDSMTEMKEEKLAIELQLRGVLQAFMRKYGVDVERVEVFVMKSHGMPLSIAEINLDVRIH